MRRFLTAAAAVTLCVAVIAASASARNPGGRDFGGAVFSAGSPGKTAARGRSGLRRSRSTRSRASRTTAA